MPDPLSILFVTSELAPFAKTGGLADVSAALPAALHEHGHDVRVFLPFYARIDRARHATEPVPGLEKIPLPIGHETYLVTVHRALLPGTTLRVHLVENHHLYDRPGIYTQDPDEHLRFVVLQHAALAACQRLRFAPDIVHANDWPTALLPLYVKSVVRWDRLIFGRARCVLTLHNVGYQGRFPASVVDSCGLALDRHLLHQDDLGQGVLNFLKTGLLYADAVTAVSPTYAREIRSPDHAFGLDRILRERGPTLVGILNGIDTRVWDPATDPLLPARYTAASLAGKAENRRALLARFRLEPDARGPVFGIVSRLTAQKGLDLVLAALPPTLLRADARLAVLGSGDPGLEQGFRELERRLPGRAGFVNGFSEELAHLIEAGADVFLMPSRFEPCGLNQMYSLRYGTVPVVRNTGGLADTVEQWDARTGRGTGFVFDHSTAAGLAWAVGRALQAYRVPAEWARLVDNGMAEDFSWRRRSREYLDLYRRLAG